MCNLPPVLKARYERSSMKRMIANAAPWLFALKEQYLGDFPEDSLWEVYGSTELGVDTVLAPNDQRRTPGSCGQAAPGVEIKLFDESGREVTEVNNVPGEVFVRSANNFVDPTRKRHDSSGIFVTPVPRRRESRSNLARASVCPGKS